jgi:HlyD family secretion protein
MRGRGKMMDRPLDIRISRRQLTRRLLFAAGGIVLVVASFMLVTTWLRPSLDRSRIRTAVVERGPVEALITATGNVVPVYEHVITSPIEARVVRIHMTPGAEVGAGEPILQLDITETRAALERLDDQIALKRNQREQALLDNASERAALLTDREIKELEERSARFEAERARQYFEEGLFSRDDVRKSENEAEVALIELRQIDESLANLEGALEKKLRELELEIAMSAKERAERARQLELATVSSDRDGVLTSVVSSEGMNVRRGEEVARVADLSAFRVEATVSDVHAARISPGLAVIVESGERRLPGRGFNIRPTVENGIVTLEVDLDDGSDPVLRHNLRVDVYIVTDRADDALRVRRGSYLTPEGTHAAFVLQEGRAVRTAVRFGITNIDNYQVLEGLNEGEEVIISDMSDYMHLQEVEIE